MGLGYSQLSSTTTKKEQQQQQQQQHHHQQQQQPKGYISQIKSNIEDDLLRRMMIQREIQMAINIARTRDTIQIAGSVWMMFVAGVGVAHISGRPMPPLVGVPIVVGGLVLGNMADLAYGNKLQRVTKEAEYILQHERGRMIPPSVAPFSKFYTADDRIEYYNSATAVGDLFPINVLVPRGASYFERNERSARP
jgi:hypothetical protein